MGSYEEEGIPEEGIPEEDIHRMLVEAVEADNIPAEGEGNIRLFPSTVQSEFI